MCPEAITSHLKVLTMIINIQLVAGLLATYTANFFKETYFTNTTKGHTILVSHGQTLVAQGRYLQPINTLREYKVDLATQD